MNHGMHKGKKKKPMGKKKKPMGKKKKPMGKKKKSMSLTAKQKKLPKALQMAILRKKRGKKQWGIIVVKRKRRKVAKDKKTGVNKKYLSGTAGSRRAKLASVLKRISRLYKQGKRVPKSLLAERQRLGKKRASKKKRQEERSSIGES